MFGRMMLTPILQVGADASANCNQFTSASGGLDCVSELCAVQLNDSAACNLLTS